MQKDTRNNADRLPRVEPTARALVASMGAEELRRKRLARLQERRFCNRFGKIFEELNREHNSFPVVIMWLATAMAAVIAFVVI